MSCDLDNLVARLTSILKGLLNLKASDLVQCLGGRRSFCVRVSLNYRYKLPTCHLESGDDPGDKYKKYNLAPQLLPLSYKSA